ncbi:MAG: DUF3305 domain-containing protein [Gammaproteobacteria bacterium]|nr:DUF3305 domain-containing protein [Gammaproteobacteria bacterium]
MKKKVRWSIAVVFEQIESNSKWLSHQWRCVGVAPSHSIDSVTSSGAFLFHPSHIELHEDEVDGYFHNISAQRVKCFAAYSLENDRPVIQCTTFSWDLADSYGQGECTVDAVPLPAELYPEFEAFVLEHYCPQPRKKRRNSPQKASAEAHL